MKFLYIQIFLFFVYCITTKSVPNPLKGSLENPIKMDRRENILECIQNFEKQYKLKIQHVDVVLGANFHLLDKFEFPYSKWRKKINKPQTTKEELFTSNQNYYFYVDSYQDVNECKITPLENLIEWE